MNFEDLKVGMVLRYEQEQHSSKPEDRFLNIALVIRNNEKFLEVLWFGRDSLAIKSYPYKIYSECEFFSLFQEIPISEIPNYMKCGK